MKRKHGSAAKPNADRTRRRVRGGEDVVFLASRWCFTTWLQAVDREVDRISGGIGLSRRNFSDWRYARAFREGAMPRQAAIDMLAEDLNGADYLRHAGIEDQASHRGKMWPE